MSLISDTPGNGSVVVIAASGAQQLPSNAFVFVPFYSEGHVRGRVKKCVLRTCFLLRVVSETPSAVNGCGAFREGDGTLEA